MTDPERKLMKFDHQFKFYLVGEPAMRRRPSNIENTIFHSKRFIGKSVFETTSEIGSHPFKVGNPNFAADSLASLDSAAEAIANPRNGAPGVSFSEQLQKFRKCQVETFDEHGV